MNIYIHIQYAEMHFTVTGGKAFFSVVVKKVVLQSCKHQNIVNNCFSRILPSLQSVNAEILAECSSDITGRFKVSSEWRPSSFNLLLPHKNTKKSYINKSIYVRSNYELQAALCGHPMLLWNNLANVV